MTWKSKRICMCYVCVASKNKEQPRKKPVDSQEPADDVIRLD
jgi:hypothetical protein